MTWEKCIIGASSGYSSNHRTSASAKIEDSAPNIFSVVFDKGEAAKHRLPLSHVISSLRELDLLIRELGQKIQRANGVRNPDGDFGIELLATSGFELVTISVGRTWNSQKCDTRC
jgi:hypothetical protein